MRAVARAASGCPRGARRSASSAGRALRSAALALLGACALPDPGTPPPVEQVVADPDGWVVLLDPSDGPAALDGWQRCPYGEADPAEALPATDTRPAHVRLPVGVPLSGIVRAADLPREPYRLEVRARRLSGTDFFCATTFPVGDEHLTAVLGGWGGGTSGLSCIDGADAARNATTTYRGVPDDTPVTLAIEVWPEEVRVELEGELLCRTQRAGHRFQLRAEVLPSAPLGVSSFAGAAGLELVRWRPLVPGP